MKFIKVITFVTILLLSFTSKAQDLSTWPEMKSVSSVVERIDSNVENRNLSALSHFGLTLKNSIDALSANNTPAQFKTKEVDKAIKNLQKLSNDFYALVERKSPDTTLVAAFQKVNDSYAELIKNL